MPEHGCGVQVKAGAKVGEKFGLRKGIAKEMWQKGHDRKAKVWESLDETGGGEERTLEISSVEADGDGG